ncbi:hypothetical protein EEA47_10935 [Vibrio alginolyticus]|uniref:hypothetical protein n=1 Tax=Vibrio alginolyticus TaxID=663 RepID=UPI00227C2773|nr:hypothetical protein [Vibrio alginolyticus]WAG26818.1 hypothetical protein EEA47_10935 [Vibrio alginolyticus]
MKKFIIVAPLSSISKRTRLYKLVSFLFCNSDVTVKHVGWERVEGEKEEVYFNDNIEKDILIKGGGYGGRKVKLMYFLWFAKVFLKGFSFKKGDVVWALGFESSFPLLLSSKIIGYKVVFDDADRFSMLFKLPSPFDCLLSFLEKITSRNVYKHIIPSIERYDFESDKFYLVKNIPSKVEIDKAKELKPKVSKIECGLTININGWLGAGRGMSVILDLAKELESYPVYFILAGKLDCQEALELSQLDKVRYIGSVTNSEALSTYLNSDLVFTYYDPKVEINRYAESNKWGDAIKFNNGIIVNSEVITAKRLIEEQVTISCNYNDLDGLKLSILSLLENPQRLQSIKDRLGNIEEYNGYFEDKLALLFSGMNLIECKDESKYV